MKIVAFTTSSWDDEWSAKREEITHPLFGLEAWENRIDYLFKPFHKFLACGTWSDPKLSPLGSHVEVVNAGIPVGIEYNRHRYQYAMAAFTSAMAYLLNRDDWDFVVYLDTDCLVGAVDFPSLFDEFEKRQEIVTTNSWCNTPSGPFALFKREACVRFLHHRIQGNCVLNNSSKDLTLAEFEIEKIFRGGWWNPWPQIESVRQDYSPKVNDPNPMAFMNCPFVRRPHPLLIEEYQSTQWSKVVPLSGP